MVVVTKESADVAMTYEGTLPSLAPLTVRAALQRRASPVEAQERPELIAAAQGVVVDPWEVQRYREVCGIGQSPVLPAPYPQVLATPLHGAILADSRFPLPVVGLVHLQNRVEQRRALEVGATLDMMCTVGEWTWDPYRGRRFSLITQVRSDGQLCWESELWALCRAKASELEPKPPREPRPPKGPGEPRRVVSALIEVPGDLGRRYAAVCGDYNPIHLHALTAKPFGFKQPIIHGMWTLARCWAPLADLVEPSGLTLEVRFRRPIYMPSKILLGIKEAEEGYEFVCEDPRNRREFLDGFVRI